MTNEQMTWNLEAMYPDAEAWEHDFAALEEKIRAFAAFRGRLAESPAVVAAAFNARLEFERLAEKCAVYAHLRADEDTSVNANVGRDNRVGARFAEFAPLESWFEPELLGLPDERFDALFSAPETQPFRRLLEELRREKEHVLSEPEERILGTLSDVTGLSGRLFETLNDTDLDFGKIRNAEGKSVPLTHGSYRTFLESADRPTRKRAFTRTFSTYKKFRNTFAAALEGTVKRHAVSARMRGYGSALEQALAPDAVPPAVYRNLIAAVRSRTEGFFDYMKLRREVLGLEKLDMFDLYNPLLPDCRREYSYDQAVKLVREALRPLGQKYGEIAAQAFVSRWIDVPERKAKRSGAYSSGCYDSFPYILLNYNGTLNDVFTIAHELGHSLHSYHSNHAQPYAVADYRIFVAEVASTTNEILLFEHLLENCREPGFRAFLYGHLADEIRATIHRQTMFAEFELFMHESIERGEPLTADFLSEHYFKLNTEYFGPEVKPDPLIALEWARIPHFHYNFYVYKYATGMSAALKLAANLRSGNRAQREAYLGFLAAGNSRDVLDIMRDAGVDLATPEPVEAALGYFAGIVAKLRRELGK